MTRREQDALRHVCPKCKATVSEECFSMRSSPQAIARPRVQRPHKERVALVFTVWRKGDKAADAGNPLRHPRAKALLLLRDAKAEIMRSALLALVNRDPLLVLTALADATEIAEAMEWARKRKEEKDHE